MHLHSGFGVRHAQDVLLYASCTHEILAEVPKFIISHISGCQAILPICSRSVYDITAPFSLTGILRNFHHPDAIQPRIQIAKTNFPLVVAAVFSALETSKVSDQHKPPGNRAVICYVIK